MCGVCMLRIFAQKASIHSSFDLEPIFNGMNECSEKFVLMFLVLCREYLCRLMAGCTAVVAMHVGNQLYVANAGEYCAYSFFSFFFADMDNSLWCG